MITRKKTLEMATPRRTGDEESARTAELAPAVLDRLELVSPLDDLEFGETDTEIQASPLEFSEDQEKAPEPEKPEKPFDKPDKPEKPENPVAEKRGQETTKFQTIKQRYLASKNYNKLVFLALGILVLVISLYLLGKQPYTVQTRLVFIIGDHKVLEKENWSPMKEFSLIQNPKTASILANRYFGATDPVNMFNKAAGNSIDSLFLQSTVINPLLIRRDYYKNPVEFESWLSKSVTFEPDFYGGQNAVSIKLTGPDPQLLKGVLLDYVSSYIDLRRMITAHSKENAQKPSATQVTDDSTRTKTLENLDQRLKKLDSLLTDYELVMKKLNLNNGPASAFSLDPSSPVFKTLARFQDKIIQLEIERGSLETRFTPQSREIKSIDLQIDGVKGLMRQYLTEQITCLKKDKEGLLAQKSQLENSSKPKTEMAEEQPKETTKSSGMLASGAKWFFLNEGLSVINENPFVSSKPLLGKIGDLKDALLAVLFSSGNSNGRRGPTAQYAGTGMQYGPPAGQYFGQSAYRGRPNMGFSQGQQSMEFYRNDMTPFRSQ
ncbi:MAG: hypothetical protein ACP5U1_11175 [Desulfomonilaceae bacterium]